MWQEHFDDIGEGGTAANMRLGLIKAGGEECDNLVVNSDLSTHVMIL